MNLIEAINKYVKEAMTDSANTVIYRPGGKVITTEEVRAADWRIGKPEHNGKVVVKR